MSATFFKHEDRERPAPAPGLEIGKVVGDFRLVSLIGQGGMGQVWEAAQISLGNRRVAMKFIRPERVTERQLSFFAREARAGGRLSHPGIVHVHGFGENDGLTWIAMEYVEGCWTLRDFLNDLIRAEEVPENYDEQVAQFLIHLAEALHAAHTAGVIHRDLKPENILITPDDKPKLTDFGLAMITDESALSQTGDFAGTYFYTSPEQIRSRSGGVDHRADIFSLGATLYEMLVLRKPFEGQSPLEVTRKILSESPRPLQELRPDIDDQLGSLCMRLLKKNPDARVQSMQEVALALRGLINNAATPPFGVVATRRARRTPTLIGALSLIAVLTISYLWNRTKSVSHSPVFEELGQDPRLRLQNFPRLVARARDEIRKSEAVLARHCTTNAAGSPHGQLQELMISSASIPATRSLATAIASVAELGQFVVAVSKACEEAIKDEVFELDLQYPASADQLLELLLHGAREKVQWSLEHGRLVFLSSEEGRPQPVPEVYYVNDLTAPLPSFFKGEGEEILFLGERWPAINIDDLCTEILESVFPLGNGEELVACTVESISILAQPHEHIQVTELLTAMRRFYFDHPLPISESWGQSGPLSISDEKARRLGARLESRPPFLPGKVAKLGELLAALEATVSMDVVISGSLEEDIASQEIPVPIEWLSARDFLDQVAQETGSFEWTIESGAVVLCPPWGAGERFTRMHAIWDIVGLSEASVALTEPNTALLDRLARVESDGSEELVEEREANVIVTDALDVLIRRSIAPESWDINPYNRLCINEQGVMIVTQTPELHAQVDALVSQLRELVPR